MTKNHGHNYRKEHLDGGTQHCPPDWTCSEALLVKKKSEFAWNESQADLVGRDLKDHLVPHPCHERGHTPLDQALRTAPAFLIEGQNRLYPAVPKCQR